MPKYVLAFTAILMILVAYVSSAQPLSRFEELVIQAEVNPQIFHQAKQLAIDRGMPVSIQLQSGTLMYPIGVERDLPVYAIITNPLHPFEGGSVAFMDEIERRYDLSSARVVFGTKGPKAPGVFTKPKRLLTPVLLVPDWTSDRVSAFDPTTGNLVDTAFIHSNSTALASPKQALEHPVHRFITVSDQITDLVQKFDPGTGLWLSWFAPSTGLNNAILDNIRGHAYQPNNNLLVTVASGTNSPSIAQFDTGGNYLGNFIAVGAGGLNSPYDIMIRESDILISQSSAPQGVQRYDLNGAYLSQWAAITSFPQQMFRMADGRIAVANFSGIGNTGIRLYDANGNFIRLLAGVTGNRGVYQLPNGNFLTTNGAGLHEIDSTTGNLVRTIQTGTNFQFINLYSPPSTALFAVLPASLSFGDVTVGSMRIDSVTVSNAGTAPLVIDSVKSDNPVFSVLPTGGVVPPSGSAKFYVQFGPTTAGPQNGHVVFHHNAATTPDSVAVSGTGTSGTVTIGVHLALGWNIVSLPVRVPVPDDSVQHVFPSSVNPYAFEFSGGYVQRFTVIPGRGYWIKSRSDTVVNITGTPIDTLTIPVFNGWNMIGSISTEIDTSSARVTPTPPSLRGSNFFKYSFGYAVAATIVPGNGYWVKANSAGTFRMNVSGLFQPKRHGEELLRK